MSYTNTHTNNNNGKNSCGFSTLYMAANYYSISLPNLNDFLMIARDLELTISGELFSVDALIQLASLYFTSVERMDFDLHSIKGALHSNHLIILAYDADKNHEPCLKQGHAAHWCLIHGYAFRNHKEENVRAYEDQITSHFLIASHGKSKYSSIWSFNDLSKSHFNLKNVKPNLDSKLHKIPTDLTGLNSCIICIKK